MSTTHCNLPLPDATLLGDLLEAVPGRVAVFGLDLRCRFANREFCEFARRGPAGVHGRSAAELLGDEGAAAFGPALARLAAGETLQWETWIETPHHGRRCVHERLLPWRSAGGAVEAFAVFTTDRTACRQAEALVARQREALHQAEKLGAMGSLLAGVAHDLNNPLAVVMGRATLLEEKTRHDPALQRDARSVREAGERCSRIVRTFLDMARQRPRARTPVQLNPLVQASADMWSYGLRSHGVALTLTLDPALPPVSADADQIGQVLMNLIVNAQQALVQRPPHERHVRVSSGSDADGCWLRVADDGGGVPAELRERIFEPFFTTKGEGSGTGLGLAMARAIAREHGGDLVLEAGTRGASFLLTLPRDEAAPLAPLAPGAVASRLLVVDDEPEVAELLAAMLQADGHAVTVARDGAQALALLEGEPFQALLCDLHMPGLDGPELWRQVSARHPAMARRMLFVTGDSLSSKSDHFLEQTGCPHLAKPFSRHALRDSLRALLACSA